VSEPTHPTDGPGVGRTPDLSDAPVDAVADPLTVAAPAEEAPARGVRAIGAEEFSAADAVGGVRGVVESVLPGVLFVVVYIAGGQRLAPALVAAAGAAVLAVVARLVQRQSPSQAFSGVLGVGIGVVWAWRTGRAEDYFVYGLWVNVAYLVGTLLSIVVRWPFVGLVMGLFSAQGPIATGSWAGAVAWRRDRALLRRYTWATWPWVAMFALRLLVQVPLYLAGQVVALGTAKLAMGLPLTVIALWISWRLVRGPGGSRGPRAARPAP